MMLAHTLGNPFDLDAVTEFAAPPRSVADRGLLRRRRFHVSGAQGGHLRRPGHCQFLSGAPHHHGRRRRRADGPAAASDACRIVPRLGPRLLVRSRASDNTCGKRFDWQLGGLPCGYDHKYTYSHIGYNLKLTDMQAAVGVAQLEKLDGFIEARAAQFPRRCAKGCATWRSSSSCPRPRPAPSRAGSVSPSRCAPGAPFTRNQRDRSIWRNARSRRACCSAATWSASRHTTNARFVLPVP